MNMSKRRRIGSSLPELPEAMIQHIQSYMSGKEAARTTLLSKSWHTAWLTRPSLDFDTSDFKYGFEQFTTKAMRRYQKLGFKIESFSLRSRHSCNFIKKDLCRKLIIEAMKIGATDLQIQVHIPYDLSFSLPKQVLGSQTQTLVKLSLAQCIVDGRYVISCPTLKSLTFNHVTITNDNVFCNILTSCKSSIEELFLCNLFHSSFTLMSCSCELQKLRRLFLCNVEVDVTIFSNDHFASRFPCLEELSILECSGCTKICIASLSLQTISFRPWRRYEPWTAKFDVPNIRKFTHSAWGLPAISKLSIKAEASREWEFDLSIKCNQLYKTSWFLNLKKYLAKYRLSRISIFVNIVKTDYYIRQPEHEVEIELAPKPLVVDSLMIDGPPKYHCALLVRLFGICRPKFITHYCPKHDNDGPLDLLCKRRQSMFGQFGLKQVKVELLPSQTPANKQKIRYQLIWNE